MIDNGENPLPPFPFGNLPPLPDGGNEEASWPNETNAAPGELSFAGDELPDWLSGGGMPIPHANESDSLPAWANETPNAEFIENVGKVRTNTVLHQPSDDTLSDYPQAQLEPLPALDSKQSLGLAYEDQAAITERIVPKFQVEKRKHAMQEELPLPPPYEADFDSYSPFAASPARTHEEPAPTPTHEFAVESSLTRTPPPVAPLDIPPVSAIWRTRKLAIAPTLEENNTVAVFRTVIRDESNRGFLNCKVSFPLPPGLKQVQASRKPVAKKGFLHWNLGPLSPGEAIPLSVKLPIALMAGESAALPRSFEVMYQPPPGARLIGEVTSPTVVPIDESFAVIVRVGNVGELPTDTITVRIGNRTHRGSTVSGSIAPLRPGDSGEVTLTLATAQLGHQDWLVTLESPGSESAESVFNTEAARSSLTLELKHDSMMRVDAEAAITLAVRNDSAILARGVTAMLTVPEELIFASATDGEYDRGLNLVGWLIGDLEPGQTRSVVAQLRGFAPGLVGLQARVEGMSGSPVTTTSNVFVEIDARSTSSTLDKLLAAMQEAVPDEEIVEHREARTDFGTRHMIFELSGTQYAVKIENIREVIRPTKMTPVPGMPDWLPGVANVRGDILSIVDLPRFLQVEEADIHHRGLLIAQSDDGQMAIGLLVNNITGIRRLPPSRSIAPELLDDNPIAAYLDGISELNGKLVPIIDLNVLFASAELNCFQMV